MKAIIDSGELGILTKIEVNLSIPGLFVKDKVKDNDIRMVYYLGGGAMMDLGCESSSLHSPRAALTKLLFPQATPCPSCVI
jgi:hypothetical protein